MKVILMVLPEVFCSEQMCRFPPQNGTSSQLWIDSKGFLNKFALQMGLIALGSCINAFSEKILFRSKWVI